jgi:hypothetical protein
MVSWRPEDKDKLGPEIFQEIEREFAAALGLAEHQRHAGVHQNTDHIHLHVAYNLIHPEKFTRHSPFRDFTVLSRVCRAMEEKYGLTVDRGLEDNKGQEKPKVSASKTLVKVKTIEAQTGQETLFSYVQHHKPELATALDAAASWREIQAAFLKYGLLLKLSGNGLAIKDRFGKHSVKASDLDRAWSKTRLETRFGPFEAPAPDLLKDIEVIETYTAAPLQAGPEREELYRRFQEERAARKTALEEIGKTGRRRYVDWREQWQRKKLEIKRLPMLRHDRQNLWQKITQREREELAALRAKTTDERKAARVALPAVSWRAFLNSRVGNEEQLLQREEKERAAVLPLESDRINTSPVERADESLKPVAGFGR